MAAKLVSLVACAHYYYYTLYPPETAFRPGPRIICRLYMYKCIFVSVRNVLCDASVVCGASATRVHNIIIITLLYSGLGEYYNVMIPRTVFCYHYNIK